jgi:pSer/pThr/pTyr-binding forkhead associated (FHA) protein
MSVRLTVKQSNEASAKTTELVLDESVITLGRDKSCQLVLAAQAVSRNHARITQEGNLFFLEDLGSAYGTQINGKPLPKGEKRLLRNGDIIAIAHFDIRFDKVSELPHDVESQKTSFVARNMVKGVMRGLIGDEERYFKVMNGPRSGERIDIGDAQELVIGRDDSADIVFRDDLISRRHVKIRRDWSGTHVEDLGSRNGIKVNRKRLGHKTLKDGDELEVGGIRLVYVSPSEAPDESASLSEEPPPEADLEGTQAIPMPREPPRRTGTSTSVDKPGEETSAEPQQAASEEPAKEEPPPALPVMEESPPEPPRPLTSSRQQLNTESAEATPSGLQRIVPLVVLGVIGLMALGLMIALFAGV